MRIFGFSSGLDAGELILIEIVVDALLFEELVVVSGLHHLTVLHYDYHVGVADCGKAVCDNQARAVLHQRYHSLLDVHFGSGVD